MAGTKISELPVATTLTGAELVPVVQSGATKQTTLAQMPYVPDGTGAVTTTVQSKLRESVSPEDFGAVGDGVTDDSAAFQLAANAGPNIRLFPGKTYKLLTGFTKTGKIVFDGSGSTILSDVAWMTITDGSDSIVSDLVMNNITTPYTIQRNYSTFASQTSSDVTQKNTGYMPTGNDSDFWSSLSAGIQNQNISPTILFKSSSSTPNTGVTITGVTARFGCIKLEGYQNSVVSHCNIQGGWGDGICFWNGLSVTFPNKTPIGFTLARGTGNKAIGNTVTTPSWNGIALWGNDYFEVVGNYVQGAGESGIKTGQKENASFTNPYPVGAVCYNGVISGNVCTDARYDGVDANSVYDDATAVYEATYNLVIGNTVKNNRSTGIVSNSNVISIIGNNAVENGVFGIRSIGANCKVSGNALTNNVTHPGILGAFSSYDLIAQGTETLVSDNYVFRGSLPAYTYAVYISGSVKYVNNTSNQQVYLTGGAKESYLTPYGCVVIGETTAEYPWGGSSYAIDAEPSGLFGGRQYSGVIKNAYYDGSTWRLKNSNGDAAVLMEQSYLGDVNFKYAPSGATNSAISWSTYLTISAGGNVYPGSDNSKTLGAASNRWSVVYAGTGTINTSDEREKQDIADLEAAEKRVAAALKGLIKKFRFKDAVQKKGDDARIHVGVIAQEVMAAFKAEGLNPMRYAIVCYDEWPDQEEIKDEHGHVVQEARSAGNRYGVRYEELLAFIISAL